MRSEAGARVLILPGYFLNSREIDEKNQVHQVLRAHVVMGGPPTELNKVDCHGFSEH